MEKLLDDHRASSEAELAGAREEISRAREQSDNLRHRLEESSKRAKRDAARQQRKVDQLTEELRNLLKHHDSEKMEAEKLRKSQKDELKKDIAEKAKEVSRCQAQTRKFMARIKQLNSDRRDMERAIAVLEQEIAGGGGASGGPGEDVAGVTPTRVEVGGERRGSSSSQGGGEGVMSSSGSKKTAKNGNNRQSSSRPVLDAGAKRRTHTALQELLHEKDRRIETLLEEHEEKTIALEAQLFDKNSALEEFLDQVDQVEERIVTLESQLEAKQRQNDALLRKFATSGPADEHQPANEPTGSVLLTPSARSGGNDAPDDSDVERRFGIGSSRALSPTSSSRAISPSLGQQLRASLRHGPGAGANSVSPEKKASLRATDEAAGYLFEKRNAIAREMYAESLEQLRNLSRILSDQGVAERDFDADRERADEGDELGSIPASPVGPSPEKRKRAAFEALLRRVIAQSEKIMENRGNLQGRVKELESEKADSEQREAGLLDRLKSYLDFQQIKEQEFDALTLQNDEMRGTITHYEDQLSSLKNQLEESDKSLGDVIQLLNSKETELTGELNGVRDDLKKTEDTLTKAQDELETERGERQAKLRSEFAEKEANFHKFAESKERGTADRIRSELGIELTHFKVAKSTVPA